MADELRVGLQELPRKAQLGGDADFLKEGVRVLSEALMELEVKQHVGAAPYERGGERSGYRNGYRQREWDTRAGTCGVEGSESTRRQFLPFAIGAEEESRAGTLRGGAGSLRPWDLYP